MKYGLVGFFVLGLVLAGGCGPEPSPMDIPLTEDNYEEVMEKIYQIEDPEIQEEVEALEFLMAFELAFSDDESHLPEELEGMTMNEILDEVNAQMEEAMGAFEEGIKSLKEDFFGMKDED